MRQQLLPYIAEPIELRPGVASKRSAAQVNLCDLVRVQLEIAKAGGGCQFRSNPVWVILCADATPLWRSSATRSENQLTQLDGSMHILRSGWGALGWKSTPWVHWICAHSNFFARKYGSIYLFSSIPTERKNQPFKRDLKNCFKGWSLRRPMFTRNGLRHVVNMDALDQGIRLVRAKGEEGTEHRLGGSANGRDEPP